MADSITWSSRRGRSDAARSQIVRATAVTGRESTTATSTAGKCRVIRIRTPSITDRVRAELRSWTLGSGVATGSPWSRAAVVCESTPSLTTRSAARSRESGVTGPTVKTPVVTRVSSRPTRRSIWLRLNPTARSCRVETAPPFAAPSVSTSASKDRGSTVIAP